MNGAWSFSTETFSLNVSVYTYAKMLGYTSKKHNISIALDPRGKVTDLKIAMNGEIIINSTYFINLLPKRLRLSA